MAKKNQEPQKRAKRTQPDPNEVFLRTATFEREAIDEKERKVPVSFSSETDKIMFWGRSQILLHEKNAVDFSSLSSVLHNHDPLRVLGRATDVRLDEAQRKGRGSIVFDDDEESLKIFRKIQSGSIRGASVGFRVDAWQLLDEGDSWTSPEGRTFKGPMDIATKWRASEFSVTPIPADSSVGVNRNGRQPITQEANMPDDKDETRGLTDPPEADEKCKKGGKKREEESETRDEKVVTMPPKPESPEDAVRRERERIRDVRALCSGFRETRELEAAAVDEGWTVEQTRKACLEKLARERPILGNEQRVTLGEEPLDKYVPIARDWLQSRTSWGRAEIAKDEKRMAAVRELGCYTLLDLARETLRMKGVRAKGLDRDALIEQALRTRSMSHTSSDFPKLLENIATKALLDAYTAVAPTWRPFAKTVSVPDFKEASAVRLGDAGFLEETPDGAPMPETSFAENREKYSVKTYSKRFGITRQTLINDDTSAFDRIPANMGAAAARTVNKVVYDLLVSNSGQGPTMTEDASAYYLFSVSHVSGLNYTAAALAISVDNLGSIKRYIRRQKGLTATGETAMILNLTPTYLLVPAALENLALQIVTQVTPAIAASVTPAWIPSLQVITEPSLDDATNGTTAWYLIASPAQIDGLWVAFLEGREQPQLIEQQGTNILGTEWGVYMDVGAKFVDHRGWYRVRGA